MSKRDFKEGEILPLDPDLQGELMVKLEAAMEEVLDLAQTYVGNGAAASAFDVLDKAQELFQIYTRVAHEQVSLELLEYIDCL